MGDAPAKEIRVASVNVRSPRTVDPRNSVCFDEGRHWSHVNGVSRKVHEDSLSTSRRSSVIVRCCIARFSASRQVLYLTNAS